MVADQWSVLFKALSEPLRIRLIHLLQTTDALCVCDLVEILNVSQSMISRHLAYLRHAGWITSRRRGLRVYHCLSELKNPKDPMAQALLAVLNCPAEKDPVMRQDLEQLQSHRSTGGDNLHDTSENQKNLA